jgi:hypothetical protein
MRSRAAMSVAAGVAVLLLAAVFIWRPYATRSREYPTTIAQAPARFSTVLVGLGPRQRACLDAIALDARSAVARFQVGTYGKPPVPLDFQVVGSGYRADVPIAASAYGDNEIVQTAVPTPGHDVEASACIVNRGSHGVALYAANAGEVSPSQATLDGKPISTNYWLGFYERRPTSIAHRSPSIAARMSIFRPGFVGPWLIWPLAALFVIAVPLGMLVAYYRALRDDTNA